LFLIYSQKIVWNNRFRNWDHSSLCLISVDGTDCPIKEPRPFNTEIYSQKLNGPGYKYEVGISIQNCDIVWINGPFPAGKADITVFKEEGLAQALCEDECVEADRGYQGNDSIKNPNIAQSREDRKQKSKVRARHEIVNGRLKVFGILDGVFRHSLRQHGNAFRAVAVIVQLGFELEGGLYDVEYNAKYD
jgi:hypothetical protein